MSKRAILYARVSTDEQAEKGHSLPTQMEECRKYVARLGYPIVAELKEDFTGKVPIYERPEGKKIAAMLKAKQADAIVAYQIDRLSRDNVDLLIAVRLWRQSGVEIHTVETGKIENENNIILVIKGWQASEEHGRIKERMRRGALAKVRDGIITAVGGRAPYGYCFEGATWAIVENEARIVRLIYQWYVFGDEHGKPIALTVITRRLSEMRIKTPGETASRRGKPRLRPNGIWGAAEVWQILKSETYTGVWQYAGITAKIPAIIDRDLWDAARTRAHYNKQMASRNTKRTYILRGLMRCAICGSAMGGAYDKRNGYCYYRCTWMINHHLGIETRPCNGKHIRAEDVEAQAWEYAQRVIFGDDFARALHAAQHDELAAQEPKRDELQAIEAEIAGAEEEVNEIAEALRKAKGRVGDKLQAQQDEVNARLDTLTQKRAELQAELAARRLTDDTVASILEWRASQLQEDIAIGRANATDEDKRRIFEMIQLAVTVREGVVENMTCVVKPSDAIVPNLLCRDKCTETAAIQNRFA